YNRHPLPLSNCQQQFPLPAGSLDFACHLVRVWPVNVPGVTIVCCVVVNEPASRTIRFNLLTTAQFDKFRAFLTDSRPTTSSRQSTLRIPVMRTVPTLSRNRITITVLNVVQTPTSLPLNSRFQGTMNAGHLLEQT